MKKLIVIIIITIFTLLVACTTSEEKVPYVELLFSNYSQNDYESQRLYAINHDRQNAENNWYIRRTLDLTIRNEGQTMDRGVISTQFYGSKVSNIISLIHVGDRTFDPNVMKQFNLTNFMYEKNSYFSQPNLREPFFFGCEITKYLYKEHGIFVINTTALVELPVEINNRTELNDGSRVEIIFLFYFDSNTKTLNDRIINISVSFIHDIHFDYKTIGFPSGEYKIIANPPSGCC